MLANTIDDVLAQPDDIIGWAQQNSRRLGERGTVAGIMAILR
jgi:hypothetical protein